MSDVCHCGVEVVEVLVGVGDGVGTDEARTRVLRVCLRVLMTLVLMLNIICV